MKYMWRFALIAFAVFWIGAAIANFTLGYVQGDGINADPASLATLRLIARSSSYAAQGVCVVLVWLLWRNAAPATTGELTRFVLMAQGVVMGLLDMPSDWRNGRPVWPYVIFVPTGLMLFHLARTRLRG